MPCPNCGRYRLENYENGKQVCEKCNWCPQENDYVDLYNLELEESLKEYEKYWSEALAETKTL